MKILLLTILLLIGQPQYLFKTTSPYILGHSGTPNTENNINYKAGPRRVSGWDGWITWLTWGQFNGVPSNASNEDMYAYYNYVLSGGTLSYNAWYDYTHHQTPIGTPYILILLAGIYIATKHYKEE